jgi:hypothetical protein
VKPKEALRDLSAYATAFVGGILVLLVSVPFFSHPWEQPGAVRRDCEPHRGHLLLTLAFAVFICWFLSLLLIPAVLGVILACLGCRLAAFDLGMMEKGLLDPNGKEKTERALFMCRKGLFLNLLIVLLWAMLGYISLCCGP